MICSCKCAGQLGGHWEVRRSVDDGHWICCGKSVLMQRQRQLRTDDYRQEGRRALQLDSSVEGCCSFCHWLRGFSWWLSPAYTSLVTTSPLPPPSTFAFLVLICCWDVVCWQSRWIYSTISSICILPDMGICNWDCPSSVDGVLVGLMVVTSPRTIYNFTEAMSR